MFWMDQGLRSTLITSQLPRSRRFPRRPGLRYFLAGSWFERPIGKAPAGAYIGLNRWPGGEPVLQEVSHGNVRGGT